MNSTLEAAAEETLKSAAEIAGFDINHPGYGPDFLNYVAHTRNIEKQRDAEREEFTETELKYQKEIARLSLVEKFLTDILTDKDYPVMHKTKIKKALKEAGLSLQYSIEEGRRIMPID